jgi:hypothetical protein
MSSAIANVHTAVIKDFNFYKLSMHAKRAYFATSSGEQEPNDAKPVRCLVAVNAAAVMRKDIPLLR